MFAAVGIGALGVTQSGRCLDLGAGAGSVPWWLCERVWIRGHIVATDIDVRLLDEAKARYPQLEVRPHDLVRDEVEPAGSTLFTHGTC